MVGGAKIVCLWHGVGFKQVYNSKYNGIALKLKHLLDHMFSWIRRDITMVTSHYTWLQFQRIFELKPDKVFITGQPRNDVLRRDIKKSDVLSNVDPTKKWVLYMPTYRGKALGEDAMEKIVKELYDNDDFNKALTENNCIFIAKLHPITPPMHIKNRDNFVVLDYSDVKNNQELVAVSDMMITDYSSCFVDFALLERPIIFYTPDEEEFLQKSEKLDDDFFRISGLNKTSTIKGLCDKISNPSNVVCGETNKLFEDPSIKGACYSENVYKVVTKAFNI